MIGHDDEFVQFEFLADLGGFEPLFPNDFAALVFVHMVIDDPAKDALLPQRA
jgi:hypothetical protein